MRITLISIMDKRYTRHPPAIVTINPFQFKTQSANTARLTCFDKIWLLTQAHDNVCVAIDHYFNRYTQQRFALVRINYALVIK